MEFFFSFIDVFCVVQFYIYSTNLIFLFFFLSRKTCQACKCPRETHAIYQEQLISVRDRLGFKQDSHTSKVDPRQLGYTWVPPGLLTSAKV